MSRHDRLGWQEMAGALAAWSLGLLAATGLVLYGIPWAAEDTELAAWRVLGLDAEQWADLHRVAGVALFAAAAGAVALGRLELTRRRSVHALAAALVVLLVVSTLLHWPPVSWLLAGAPSETTGEIAGTTDEGLPYPEAVDEPLAQLARNLGMDTTRVTIALQEAKLRFQGLDESLAEIAERNGTSPEAVYDAIRHLEAPALAPHEEGTLDLIEARFDGARAPARPRHRGRRLVDRGNPGRQARPRPDRHRGGDRDGEPPAAPFGALSSALDADQRPQPGDAARQARTLRGDDDGTDVLVGAGRLLGDAAQRRAAHQDAA